MDGTATVGTSTNFSREDHVHPFDTATVRVNAQSLTATQQQQARQNIVAAPFDALAYNGLQINGAMEVCQVTGGVSADFGYACDGWRLAKNGTMAVLAYGGSQQGSFTSQGFPYLLGVDVNTAAPSLAAGDYVCMVQPVEGYRTARLLWGTSNAQPITISFWTAHHRTGLYSVALYNAAGVRGYVTTYTQNVADAAEYKTVTIPGDTAGTWNFDNTVGINIVFVVACGSTNTAPSINTWLPSAYFAAPGQVNGVGATTDHFHMSGFTVHPGNEAPSAARSPLIARSYAHELQTCMRYYQILNISDSRWFGDGNSYAFMTTLPVVMRAAPSIDASNLTTGGQLGGYPQYSAGVATFLLTRANAVAGYCSSSGYVKLNARF
jgi:hypothetical protein